MSTKKLSNEIVDERLKYKEIERVGNYINSHTNIEFKCKKDGFIWNAKPYNILYELSGCPKCSKCEVIDDNIIDKRLVGRKITRVSKYKKMHEKMQFKCEVCNHIWKAKPYTIVNSKQGCPKCAIKNKFLTNEYIDDKIKNKPFIRVGEYVDAYTSIEWKCKNDGFIWKTIFTEILRGSGCPICKNKHEKKIKAILENEYKINNMKPHKLVTSEQHNRKFYIDFYFEIGNKKLGVEYNGIQHYQPVRFNGISQELANENFEKQKNRDIQLIEYCANNNIDLVWIPYWFTDKQIHTLLNEFLGYFV
jgi:DNA replicative helicase MCM subunit Mcm2 (Cdc46/Mcm family)